MRILALAMRLCLRNLTFVKADRKTEIFRYQGRNGENCRQSCISSH